MVKKQTHKRKNRRKKKEPTFLRLIKWLLLGSNDLKKNGRGRKDARLIKKTHTQRSKQASKMSLSLLLDFLSGKKITRKRILRTFVVVGSVLAFLVWSGINSLPPTPPAENKPPLLYASQCNDDLRKVFLSSIHEAKQSIHLVIYSLTDEKILNALQKKAAEGVAVTIVHDPSTPKIKIPKKGVEICTIPWKGSGLMHQKILVVDQKQVWVGSANMTTESLRLHDNNIVGMCSYELARAVENREHLDLVVGGQWVEFWILPEEKKQALNQLLSLIQSAKSSLKVAMFAWTHPQITQAVIEAHNRGVAVEVVIDHGQGVGVSERAVHELLQSGVSVGLSQTELLHHKCALIDDKTLITGSANWTRAAFSRNEECFLVIHDLTDEQRKKVKSLWHAIRATRQLQNKMLSSIVLQSKAA